MLNGFDVTEGKYVNVTLYFSLCNIVKTLFVDRIHRHFVYGPSFTLKKTAK